MISVLGSDRGLVSLWGWQWERLRSFISSFLEKFGQLRMAVQITLGEDRADREIPKLRDRKATKEAARKSWRPNPLK